MIGLHSASCYARKLFLEVDLGRAWQTSDSNLERRRPRWFGLAAVAVGRLGFADAAPLVGPLEHCRPAYVPYPGTLPLLGGLVLVAAFPVIKPSSSASWAPRVQWR